ncbi:MAG TPA: MFS transporter, partial [Betaproteobacteria bacterium]|nr:MFS transporter [Betaproteobacteria bacterium]
MPLPSFARALAHRNFRLYLSGQGISLIGTWTQQVAMGWLAYRLSGSAVWLGVIGFSGQIPILLFASFGGVWSDRFDRHRLLFWTQALAMAQALLLAALVLGHVVQIWHLVVLAAVLGVVNAVDAPLRQAFVVQLVDDRADLPNAIALNSLAINSSRLVGPAAAGFLISWLGEGVCFLLNGLSYVAVLWALRRMKTTSPHRRRSSMREGLKDGFSYAFGFPPVRALLSMMTVLGLTIVPYMVLMPVYAKHVFHGDAQTLGLLMGGAGLGALMGAVFLAARRSV